jgi:hypothetical protein
MHWPATSRQHKLPLNPDRSERLHTEQVGLGLFVIVYWMGSLPLSTKRPKIGSRPLIPTKTHSQGCTVKSKAATSGHRFNPWS